MLQIDRDNLEQQIWVAFPELESSYRKTLRDFGNAKKLGSYMAFGLVLKPRLIEELRKCQRTGFLERVGTFLEAVCLSGDLEAINVVWLEIFQWVVADTEQLKCLWPVLGEGTKKQARDAAERWGYAKNLPE
jgi:hypothetical protein